MKLKGINSEFKGEAMLLALRQAGFRRSPKCRWPRVKGSIGSGRRIDVSTGQVVGSAANVNSAPLLRGLPDGFSAVEQELAGVVLSEIN